MKCHVTAFPDPLPSFSPCKLGPSDRVIELTFVVHNWKNWLLLSVCNFFKWFPFPLMCTCIIGTSLKLELLFWFCIDPIHVMSKTSLNPCIILPLHQLLKGIKGFKSSKFPCRGMSLWLPFEEAISFQTCPMMTTQWVVMKACRHHICTGKTSCDQTSKVIVGHPRVHAHCP